MVTKYQVVGGVNGVYESRTYTLRQLLKKFEKVGVCSGQPHNTRKLLIGQPILKGLLGPMYGGPGKVRYETQEVYDILSR